jgi:ferredoxin
LPSGPNMQVALIAVGFTSMFFIIIALAGALYLGYGRRPSQSSRSSQSRRAPAVDDWRESDDARGSRGGNDWLAQDDDKQSPRESRLRSIEPPPPVEQPAPSSERTHSGFAGSGKFGVSRRSGRVSIEVNPGKCARFGFCEHEAPDVFYLQSDGRFGYQASVPVAQVEEVIAAMDVCPRRAIKVKLPKDLAEARMRPPAPAEDPLRKVIPIMDRAPDDGRRFGRGRA